MGVDLERLQELLTSQKTPERDGEGGCLPEGFTSLASGRGEVYVKEEEVTPAFPWRPEKEHELGPLVPPEGTKLENLLFLDTETTGLGGSGVYSFLVGTARIRRGRVELSQWLLPNPAQEGALLEQLQSVWSPDVVLVTYNGKAFDWPLLMDRFIINGQETLSCHFHLDLLFWVRRLLGGSLSDCRLLSVERELLGRLRPLGMEGFEVPEAYYDYLRTGNTAPLTEVVKRNRNDVLSLVELLAQVTGYWQGELPRGREGRILLGMARTCEERGQLHRALDYYRDVAGREGEYRQRLDAMTRLAFLLKRQGETAQARYWFTRACEHAPENPRAAVELAKFYEHQDKDYRTARSWVLRALNAMDRRMAERWQKDLLHRLARLDRKLRGACGSKSPCTA